MIQYLPVCLTRSPLVLQEDMGCDFYLVFPVSTLIGGF